MSLCPASDLLKRLRARSGQRLLSDGGMGSELIRQGIPPSRTLSANTGHTEQVRTIHQAYLDAGADLLSANTFGLPNFEDADDWIAQITAGQALAEDAARRCERDIGVWTTLAPDTVLWALTGHRQWPTRDGVGDALLIETCVTLPQAVSAIRAVRQSRLLHPSLLAVTCHFCPDGILPDGSLPDEVARALTQAGADVIGGNCGEVPECFLLVAERMRQSTDLPLLFQPNAGLPQTRTDPTKETDEEAADDLIVYPVTSERFAHLGAQLWEKGVAIIGGCCGTTPAYIHALALQSARRQPTAYI